MKLKILTRPKENVGGSNIARCCHQSRVAKLLAAADFADAQLRSEALIRRTATGSEATGYASGLEPRNGQFVSSTVLSQFAIRASARRRGADSKQSPNERRDKTFVR